MCFTYRLCIMSVLSPILDRGRNAYIVCRYTVYASLVTWKIKFGSLAERAVLEIWTCRRCANPPLKLEIGKWCLFFILMIVSLKKQPIIQLINSHIVDYPTPSNISYF